jgi:hypothetical protein
LLAYGLLELKPSEFFELTPREFTLMYDGWKQREERKARYVQWLLSPHMGKKTPKLHEITGFENSVDSDGNTVRKFVPREEQDATLAELREMLLR